MSRKRRNNARNTENNRGQSRKKTIPLLQVPPKPVSRFIRTEISGKTPNQKVYIQAIQENDLTVCVGPAGTGKTFIATAMALLGMRDGLYDKITITRPMVQAGEDTGFLPGDMHAKLAPYLRPVYDTIRKFVDGATIKRWIDEEKIDIVPFAYMRGLTLENTFVVGDECQNATEEQLDMLVTRFGDCSKMVICGDCTQSDLKFGRGALHLLAVDIAPRMIRFGSNTAVVELQESDIVRHKLVREFVLAKKESKDEKGSSKNSSPERRLHPDGGSELETGSDTIGNQQEESR